MWNKVFSHLDEYAVWYRVLSCGFVQLHFLDCPVYLLICDVSKGPSWRWVLKVLWNCCGCWIWRWEESFIKEFSLAFIVSGFSDDFFCYWVLDL